MADRRTDNDPDFNPDEQQMLEVVDEDLNTSGSGGDHRDDAGAATTPSGDLSGNAAHQRSARRHTLTTDGTRTGWANTIYYT